MRLFKKAPPPPPPVPPSRDPGRRVVLIVDDDLTVSELNQSVFMGREWSVTTAYDGLGALSALNTDKPDLVLLDLMLPDVPGEKVIESIRSLKLKTKVIVVTGRHVTKRDFEPYAGIVVWVLQKPFPMVDLRALIDWFEGGALMTPKLSGVGDV